MIRHIPILYCVAILLVSCGTQKKVSRLYADSVSAEISIPSVTAPDSLHIDVHPADTIMVHDSDGNEVLIMKAVKDDSGEMVATDVIEASRVVARFRNVAERQGKVDLQFDIIVPERLQDSKWQLRFYPHMLIHNDSVKLDPVIVTGREYRKAQLRGYQHYERFLKSLITDSNQLLDEYQLEIFLRRNLPQIYAFRNDTTFVSEEVFSSYFGITEKKAVDHYTNHLRLRLNDYRKSLTDKKYHKYVRVPVVTEGLRLDTVLQSVNGDIVYQYTQTVNTRPKLRKVDISLEGEIYEMDRKIYAIPETGPLSFYISSISSFVDNTERYLTEIVERRVEANTACYIDFDLGRHEIRMDLSDNREEISRIQDNLYSLVQNQAYDLDSIVVTASASPEGQFKANDILSRKRSESVSVYFNRYLSDLKDSIARNSGISISLDDMYDEGAHVPDIKFVARNNPENWVMLDAIVARDEVLTQSDKDEYMSLARITDWDQREMQMQKCPWYGYVRQSLYPRLRTVRFDFHLHRKGMMQDTVHTTVLDSVYMRGVKAIRDMDYESAVTILRPYQDYNAAVAFCCMDYNESALAILNKLESTAQVKYLLAIIHSRKGEDRDAVQNYLDACNMDSSYIHRGNLDPEISALVRKYGLAWKDEELF